MVERLLVVGGGAAGMSAASRARKFRPEMEITVVEETKMVSHAPCGIPYYVEGLFHEESLFMTYTPEFFRKERKIDVRIGSRVTELDLDSRVASMSGGEKYEYDYLVIATGAVPKDFHRIEGSRERVFFVHHPAHAKELRERLWSLNKIAVIGGGILGVEMAEALTEVGKKVTLIHRGNYVLNKLLDEDLGKVVTDVMSRKVDLRLSEEIEEIRDGRLVKTNWGKYEVDGVILALGVRPNVELVEGRIKLGETGAIYTNEFMETNRKNVFAAGDVAETTHIVSGTRVWMPFAPVANKMGFVAGSNIGGARTAFPGTTGNMITKFEEWFVGKVGLSEREAKTVGLKTIGKTIKAKTRARYYPGGKDIYVRLVAEVDTNRLLGAQIVGGEEVLGRLDAVSVALQRRVTVEELFFAEMGYLPAISQVWDPLTVAARQLLKD